MTPETEKKAKAMLYLIKNNSIFVVFDRESTSVQPDIRYGRITELSAVKIQNGEIIGTFDTLVDPEIPIPKKIKELTGIDNEMCKGKPKYEEAVKKFLDFCGNYPVIAHNGVTDIRYINYYANRIGRKFNPNLVDTMTLARYLHRFDKNFKTFKLEYLAACYHIKDDSHHRAMNDVIVTMELFLKFKRILKRDIYNSKESDFLDTSNLQTELKQSIDMKKLEVRSCNLWKKEIKGKKYCRLYVKIYYNKEYNDIYYDFDKKNWGVKGSLTFELPPNYGKIVMEKIAEKKHQAVNKCYDVKTYM